MSEMLPKLAKQKTAADEALANANAAILHRMFSEKCEEINTIVAGFGAMMDSGGGGPLPQNDTAITAMRDVALAAIELARDTSRTKALDTDATM